MSQIKFNTTYKGRPAQVMAGWDNPLRYYHLTIFNSEPKDDEEEIFYSDLDDHSSNCFSWKTIEPLKKKLNELGIEDIPDGFWDRVEEKLGNHVEMWNGKNWWTLSSEYD